MYSPCPCPPLYQYKPNQVDVYYYYYYCAITYMYPCYLKMDVYRVIKLRHSSKNYMYCIRILVSIWT